MEDTTSTQGSSTTASAPLLDQDIHVSSSKLVDVEPVPSLGALPPILNHAQRMLLLGGSFLILFVRYTIATFLSSFFPQLSSDVWNISYTFNGIIFAAYPLGMSITSIFAPQAIAWMGTRTATGVGLVATTVLTLIFGFAPDMASMPLVQWLFLVSYFLSGLIGALAETACIIMASATFRRNPAMIMAAINTVCSIGCMLGPPIGGVIYALGQQRNADMAFRLPFIVCAAIPLLLLPLLPWFMPQRHIGDASECTDDALDPTAAASTNSTRASRSDAGTGDSTADTSMHGGDTHELTPTTRTASPRRRPLSRWALLSPSIILGLSSIALSGMLVGTLDPTLSIRLSADPFHYSAATISLFFTYSSIVYTLVSTPCGWLIDRHPNSPRLYKLITLVGFLHLALTFALLAPMGTTAFGAGPSGGADPMQRALNNPACTATAMVLKGIGSALSNCAIYPDLIVGIPPGEDFLQATISSLWNAAYAIGWAAGPFLGDALMQALDADPLCIDKKALPPHCPPTATSSLPLLNATPAVSSSTVAAAAAAETTPMLTLPRLGVRDPGTDCSCSWKPGNGFDGFGTSMALLALAYCVPLGLAALLNSRGPNRRFMQGRARTDVVVEPLSAAALPT